MNELRVVTVILDIQNELESLDKYGFSGFTPSGRKLSKMELSNMDGMYHAYRRILSMLQKSVY